MRTVIFQILGVPQQIIESRGGLRDPPYKAILIYRNSIKVFLDSNLPWESHRGKYD